MSTVASTTATPVTGTLSKVSNLTSAADQEDRFMKLLVAQMKNQDPLNPMDNAQMTSQIAQINTVGGIQQLNATVQSLLGAFQNLQAQSSTDLAGRSVLVAGGNLQLAGGKATGGVQLGGSADTVNVDILGADGKAVRSLSLGASPAGVRSFAWDGKAADGSTVPDGSYTLRVTASQGGKPVTAQTLTAQDVLGVETAGDGSVQLDLGSAGLHPLSDVKSYL
ncbi:MULTISPECIES: flagellar hook assembly protein FlgD [Ramlibacter]|uniref:Basal-body rod modification protein FlgD n=1 Tax=Ramlibacter aquaticus TaxID=2780094 RepID=A0ABR9SGZ1_9BURK|nr:MULTISPECIES: flagellar hook assembly protein FlgD [Ramlibacter]MBE7941540.1 flagellar hook assembly protein FlgD [Ramlibacter aquaticus]